MRRSKEYYRALKEHKATLLKAVDWLQNWLKIMQQGDVYIYAFDCIKDTSNLICETATSVLQCRSWIYVGFIHDAMYTIRQELKNSREYKHDDGRFSEVVYYYEKQYVFKIISYSISVALAVIDIIKQEESKI